MAIVYKECVADVDVSHFCNACNDFEKGGVRSLILIEKGTDIVIPYVQADWLAAIEAGNIIIVPETSGTFDGGTPKMVTGRGDRKEMKSGDDYVLTAKDYDYKENREFWEKAEKKQWNIAFRSKTQLMYVNSDVSLTAKAPLEEDIDTDVAWNVELKWFSTTKPVNSAVTPIAEFFKCFEIGEEG